MAVLLLLTCMLMTSSVLSHSWLTCPPSFSNTQVGRGGVQDRLCENDGNNAYLTEVQAGDRLKVGWTANNHAGGYVRLSLVPFGDQENESALKRNVMKFVCYGHDTRPFKTRNGDCKHPCNARGGCNYQSDIYNIHRFDTTLTIPTNLPDGLYVLQAAMLVGNSKAPYHSCSKLRITRGNPGFRCPSNAPALKYSCLRSGGPALDGSSIETGTRAGDFCYRLNGQAGSVDEYLRDVPINVECDPRLSCANSVDSNCINEQGMDTILNANSHPQQPGCRVYTQIPEPEGSCTDGVENRDEEDVDCGGKFCGACPVVVHEGDYYSNIEVKPSAWASGAVIQIVVHLSKNVTAAQCWELSTQFQVPLELTGATWGDGQLVRMNEKIFKFSSPAWFSGIMQGRTLSVSMQVKNVEYLTAQSEGKGADELAPLDWTFNPDKLSLLTGIFDVNNSNECETAS